MTTPAPGSAEANLQALRSFQAQAQASPRDDDEEDLPRASRPRKAPQPVDRSALHGPLADMPRSRAQALAEGAPFYFLGLTCTRRHNAPRTTTRRTCVACQQEDHQKALQAAARARKKARAEAAAQALRDERKALQEAERLERQRAKAAAKAAATRAATKAAREAAAATAPAPTGPVVDPLPALPEAPAPWDDSAPWDVDPVAPSSVVAAPPAATPAPVLPFDPMSASPAPWDDASDINPFD